MKFCTHMYLDNPTEFKGHWSQSREFLVFFCVHDAAATRGQYLALSKAWRSCYFVYLFTMQNGGAEVRDWPGALWLHQSAFLLHCCDARKSDTEGAAGWKSPGADRFIRPTAKQTQWEDGCHKLWTSTLLAKPRCKAVSYYGRAAG